MHSSAIRTWAGFIRARSFIYLYPQRLLFVFIYSKLLAKGMALNTVNELKMKVNTTEPTSFRNISYIFLDWNSVRSEIKN